jgi:hypothetical protein
LSAQALRWNERADRRVPAPMQQSLPLSVNASFQRAFCGSLSNRAQPGTHTRIWLVRAAALAAEAGYHSCPDSYSVDSWPDYKVLAATIE